MSHHYFTMVYWCDVITTLQWYWWDMLNSAGHRQCESISCSTIRTRAGWEVSVATDRKRGTQYHSSSSV